jgi:hypothetical protein
MILNTIEKINGEWWIWKGDPKVLRTSEAIAGPFAKRYMVLEAAVKMTVDKHGDNPS